MYTVSVNIFMVGDKLAPWLSLLLHRVIIGVYSCLLQCAHRDFCVICCAHYFTSSNNLLRFIRR